MNIAFIRFNIKRYFPGHNVDRIFGILSEIPHLPDGYRPDFLYQDILRLSGGSEDKLREWVTRATADPSGVSRAGAYVETWEAVVERYEEYERRRSWPGAADFISPLLAVARQCRFGEVGTRYHALTSHSDLVVCTAPAEFGAGEYVRVFRAPIGAPATLSAQRCRAGVVLESADFTAEEATRVLQPILRRLKSPET